MTEFEEKHLRVLKKVQSHLNSSGETNLRDVETLIQTTDNFSEFEADSLPGKFVENGFLCLEDTESGQKEITKVETDQLESELRHENLEDVYEAYREHYYFEDTRKIDVLLATALSVKQTDKNIWLLYVGASGVGKSALTAPLNHVKFPEDQELAYLLSDLTTYTIVSGQVGSKSDLAPKLDGKVLYVPDFSTVIGKSSEDQKELFGQLRNLYDGFAKKDSGTAEDAVEYNPDVTFIGNVTPGIHSKNLIHRDLGTRFLYYEFDEFNERKVMDKVWEESNLSESEINEDIGESIQLFLQKAKQNSRREISDSAKKEMETIAKWTAKMRSKGNFNRSRTKLESSVVPEKHTRIAKQFKKIYENLMRLSEDYKEERALEIIRRIGASSIDPDKRRIFVEIEKAPGKCGMSIGNLIDRTGLGRKAVERRLLEMSNVGILSNEIYYKEESGRINYSEFRVKEGFKDLAEELDN